MKTNQEIINETIRILNENQEWKERYAGYASEIASKSETYRSTSNHFRYNPNLSAYTTISEVKKTGSFECDLRFIGQSIGKVNVKEQKDKTFKITFTCERGLIDLKEKRKVSLPDVKQGDKLDWNSAKMKDIRKTLFHIDIESAETKSPEHKCENLLLEEFSKKDSESKSLCNIQPVKLASKFFYQLSTPISASAKGMVSYSGNKGGGIDILARVRRKNNRCNLAVIELKDENNDNEPMSVVIQQALSYATFLALLLESESGKEWWNIFGFKGKTKPKHPIIDVVGLMPNDKEESIQTQKYKVGSFELEVHTLYFDKNALYKKNQFEFSGDYVNELMHK